jgi:hypothetical protein
VSVVNPGPQPCIYSGLPVMPKRAQSVNLMGKTPSAQH